MKLNYHIAETYIKSNQITTNPFSTTFDRLYSPKDSAVAYQLDKFRYCREEGGNTGYWWSDLVCMCRPFVRGTNSDYCFRQSFQADEFNTEVYEGYDGVIGLGFGTPRFGNTFLYNLRVTSNNRYSEMFSVVGGYNEEERTSVFLGGPAWDYIKYGAGDELGLHWYPLVSDDAW